MANREHLIHPTIVTGKSYEDKEPAEIPICFNYKGCEKKTTSKENATLKELYCIIEEKIKNKNRRAGGLYYFKLDTDINSFVSRTLDDVVLNVRRNKLDDLSLTIVLCCPLHYINSDSFKNGDDKVTKLIYHFDHKEIEGNDNLVQFFNHYVDGFEQKDKNICFYKSMESVATQWFDLTEKLIFKNMPWKTEQEIIKETTHEDCWHK